VMSIAVIWVWYHT